MDYMGKIGIEGRFQDGNHKIGLYGGSQNVNVERCSLMKYATETVTPK